MALIAERELTPETRANVAALLAVPVTDAGTSDETTFGLPELAVASNWADEIVSKRPETGPWHYVNIPVTESGYVHDRDCPAGACVVAQIDRLRGVLSSHASSPTERAEALRFLVHLVGDIHQPLHAACSVLLRRPHGQPDTLCGGQRYGDRGGNEIKVRFGDLGINLHQVWDTELLYELRGSVKAVAERLASDITPTQRREWAGGGAEQWANESYRLAQSLAYGLLPKERRIVIPLRYETQARLAVEVQLKRGGVRLARLLNDALNPSAADPAAPPSSTPQRARLKSPEREPEDPALFTPQQAQAPK